MHRRSLIGIWICFLAIWMQLLAPAAAMAMQRPTLDPLSVICHHSTDDGAGRSGQHDSGHQHHCCPLCQCHHLGSLLPDGRPTFTTFDYPVASPLRWRAVAVPAAAGDDDSLPQPRGPPILD